MAISQPNLRILETRGLDPEILVRYGVDDSPRLGSSCIVIPFRERGHIVNRKYRTIDGDKRFLQETGARKVFWNVDVIADQHLSELPLIITEGELDALSAIQAGFLRTVSVPDGAPPQELGDKDTTKYLFLDNAPQALRDVTEIILATDGDDPGANLMHDLALRLGRARCKWVKYPKGCKDLNDALRVYGVRGVSETIARAQWIALPGVYRLGELPPLPERRAYDMGLPVLGDHFKLRLGDMTVMTGIPGHGKSTFINEVACRMALNFAWPAAFASFEQTPQTDHRRALRSWYHQKRVIQQTFAEIAEADEWIDRMFTFVVPSDDDDVTLEWTLERLSASVVRNGAKLVIVDPWNEMDHVRPPDMSLTEYTGFAIKQFRRFARKHQVHLVIAAHPVKQKKLDSGEFAIPTLYDISDSQHWYNKSDVGLVVHRTSEETILRIAKTRYHDQIGVPGDVRLTFDKSIWRYRVHNASGVLMEEPR